MISPATLRAARRLSEAVDAFRRAQHPDGRVVADPADSSIQLDSIVEQVTRLCRQLGQVPFASAFAADVREWQQTGLACEPCFDRTQETYRAPAHQGLTFFAGPVLATHGPLPRGYFLECFLALRDEPLDCEEVAAEYPHPRNKCQPARLIAASDGIRRGNCIDFFPDNIRTRRKGESQDYGLFFFNKFQPIYLNDTMPRVRQVFGERDALFDEPDWRSAALSAEDCYRARCIWGYLHDYFHHCGPRPLDLHRQAKLSWSAGVLEEIKCDCQTVMAAARGRLRFGAELLQFVLFERMVRYPGHPDAPRDLDAGAGVLLFEWLVAQGAIGEQDTGRLGIDLAATITAMQALVDRIETLERIADDRAYKAAARALVRSLLPEGAGDDRFSMPAAYHRMIRPQRVGEPIDFAAVPLY